MAKGLDAVTREGKAAVAASRKLFDDGFERMQKAGVRGLDGLKKVPNYFPRLPRRFLFEHLEVRLKSQQDVDGTVARLIASGIKKAREADGLDFDEALTDKVSVAYARRLLTDSRARPDNSGLETKDLEFIEDILADNGVADADIASALKHFRDANESADVPSDRLKTRIKMDESVSVTLDDGSSFQLADLFEDDIEHVTERYSREVAGLTALAEMNLGTPREAFAFVDDLLGQHRISPKEANAARVTLNGILSRQQENDPTGTFSRFVRTMGNFNFVTKMGQVFWSMLAENGSIMAVNGLRATLQVTPELRSIVRDVISGKLDTELAQSFAALAEPGSSLLLNSVSMRPDDLNARGLGGTPLLRAIDDAGAASQRAVSLAGGLLPLQDVQQRVAAVGLGQAWFNLAKSGKAIPKAWRDRMLDYGMDDADMAGLLAHMGTNVELRPDGVIKNVRGDLMEPALLRKVQVMFHRMTRQVVQEADIGASMPWMHKSQARLLTQFRSFSIVAMERRTLHSLARRDVTSGLMLMYGMMWAGAAQLARVHLNSPEGSPAREALKDPVQLAKTAFAATGEATVIPMIVDSFVRHIGEGDPFFNNFNRSTELGSDVVGGIPAVDTLNKLARVAGIPASALRSDRDVTEQDITAAAGLIPLNNVLGMTRFTKFVAKQFPSDREEAKRKREREALEGR